LRQRVGTEELIRERLDVVRERVVEALGESGRSPDGVRILVASKYYAPEQMAVLARAGVELLGENKAEDLLRKQEEFEDTFEWHFIGHLQRRKVKEVVTRVALIHSVDSVRLVEELAKRGEGASTWVRYARAPG
jgi:PLP dependent protein